jgi:hypothetical protein
VVRKGEKAAFVVFYKELEVAAETGEAETERLRLSSLVQYGAALRGEFSRQC